MSVTRCSQQVPCMAKLCIEAQEAWNRRPCGSMLGLDEVLENDLQTYELFPCKSLYLTLALQSMVFNLFDVMCRQRNLFRPFGGYFASPRATVLPDVKEMSSQVSCLACPACWKYPAWLLLQCNPC